MILTNTLILNKLENQVTLQECLIKEFSIHLNLNYYKFF